MLVDDNLRGMKYPRAFYYSGKLGAGVFKGFANQRFLVLACQHLGKVDHYFLFSRAEVGTGVPTGGLGHLLTHWCPAKPRGNGVGVGLLIERNFLHPERPAIC